MFARLPFVTVPRWAAAAAIIVLASWYSGSFTQADPPRSSAPNKSLADDLPSAAPPTNVIDALRQQITANPALKEADPDGHLLNSLEAADELFQRAKQQNRDAIRQLNRQPRVGAARQSPHLVLITVDTLDHSPGGNGAPLPSWTSITKDAVRFTQHYAGGSDLETGHWTMLTGLNSGRATHPVGESRTIRSSDEIFIRNLWKAGYDTVYLGPWTGPVHPLQKGFDAWTGCLQASQSLTEFPVELSTARTTMRVSANEHDRRGASLWRLLAIEADGRFARLAERPRPLFLHVRLPRLNELSAAANRARWDETILQILTSITAHGLESQTCVVLTGLTGSPQDKDDLRESALRTPLVIRCPGRWTAGPLVQEDVTLACDVGPTLLDLAAALPQSARLDGRSLLPILRGQSPPDREVLYWKSSGEQAAQAVRQGNWKAIYSARDRQLRLYDLSVDPGERTDVAAEHRDIARKLVHGPAEVVERIVQ